MNANIETTTDRKKAIAELFTVTRLMANVPNNVNQLAKFANAEGQFPADAGEVVAEYRGLMPCFLRVGGLMQAIVHGGLSGADTGTTRWR